jgi:hypothetical protein
MFLGHPDPPLFFTDLGPDPSINKQKNKENFEFCYFCTFLHFIDVDVPSKRNKQKTSKKITGNFLLASSSH